MNHIHNYTIIGHNERSIVEVCGECKKRLVTKLDDKGRSNNREYLKEHISDTCQPTGATSKIFERFYGKPKK